MPPVASTDGVARDLLDQSRARSGRHGRGETLINSQDPTPNSQSFSVIRLGVGAWELGVDDLMDCIVQSSEARISYTVEGPPERPVLLFINSIGTTRDLWLPQVPALVGTYRIIRYD